MHAVIHQIARRLARHSTVESVWLFGSRARGDNRERSDIDLAIVCPNASALNWDGIVHDVDAAQTLLKIDLVRYDTAPLALQHEIMSEGIPIYERQKHQTIRA